MCVCVCVCVCVCLCVRRRAQSLNQSTDLVQIRYIGSSFKYLKPFFFSPNPKIKDSSHEKEIKVLIFSKKAPTILIKFCGFIVHSNPNNMTLSGLMQGLNQLINHVQNRDLESSRKYLEPVVLVFTPTLKLRVVHVRKKFKILIFQKWF